MTPVADIPEALLRLRERVADALPQASESIRELVVSSLATEPPGHPTRDIHAWLEERQARTTARVEPRPLDGLDGWSPDADGNLRHRSGRFFSVEGLHARLNLGDETRAWSQPIVRQPEIGILGLLGQRRGGVLLFLMQAKIEPGNIGVIQLSPTVQATRSNYTRAHGGGLPPYLAHFLTPAAETVLVDHLQSEQGSRFLHKKNRNVALRLPDDAEVEEHPDFRWMSLGQLRAFLEQPNRVNMEARSVLASLPLEDA